jgi:cell division septation protein DedD
MSFQVKYYHVIIACFEEKDKAENLVAKCKKTEYDNAEILSFTEVLYFVSIGKFTSLNEATDKKQKYDKQFGENSLIIRMK